MSTFRFCKNDDGRLAVYIQPATLATLTVIHNGATVPVEVDVNSVQAVGRIAVCEGDNLELMTTSKKTGRIISHVFLEVINSMEESDCYGFFVSSKTANSKLVETWEEGDFVFFDEKPELHITVSHRRNGFQFHLDQAPENYHLFSTVNGVENEQQEATVSWDNLQDTDTVYVAVRNADGERVASVMFDIVSTSNVCRLSNIESLGRTGNLQCRFLDVVHEGTFFDWAEYDFSYSDEIEERIEERMKLHALGDSNKLTLWVDSRVNFLEIENNGIEQTSDKTTCLTFEVSKNDSIDIRLMRNGTTKVVGSMTLRVARLLENNSCNVMQLYIFPDMTENLDLYIAGDIEMLQELPERKFIDHSGDAEYKIALHEEDATIVHGAKTEDEAVNAAIWHMGDNSPFCQARVLHNGATIHRLGANDSEASEAPAMLMSTRDYNCLYIGFSCQSKIKTAIFDGEKVHEEKNNSYILHFRKGQKFIVSVSYPDPYNEGQTLISEVTYHYIEGTLLQGASTYVDMTLFVECKRGSLSTIYSQNIKFLKMHEEVYMLLPKKLEARRFHFSRERVYEERRDAFAAMQATDTMYQCFVPETHEDNGIVTASRIYVVRSL